MKVLRSLLLWAGAIWLVCYLFGLSPAGIIKDLVHGAQAAHNSSVNGGRP